MAEPFEPLATKPMARPDGWYRTSVYDWPRSGVMSEIRALPTAAFSKCAPEGSANTMARPFGRPQESGPGSILPAGLAALDPTPRTARPPSTTRSALGPHSNGPGSDTANRQVKPDPSGATAQARPPATNVTVAAAAGTPAPIPCVQPSGSDAISGARARLC